ncbi:DUF3459 domain-containing protein [Streptomyces sp. MN13]
MYHYYRRLIALRHTEPVVAHGDFTPLLTDGERVYAFTRRYEDTELLVLGHFTGEPADVRLHAGWEHADLVIGNVQDTAECPAGKNAIMVTTAALSRASAAGVAAPPARSRRSPVARTVAG